MQDKYTLLYFCVSAFHHKEELVPGLPLLWSTRSLVQVFVIVRPNSSSRRDPNLEWARGIQECQELEWMFMCWKAIYMGKGSRPWCLTSQQTQMTFGESFPAVVTVKPPAKYATQHADLGSFFGYFKSGITSDFWVCKSKWKLLPRGGLDLNSCEFVVAGKLLQRGEWDKEFCTEV